MNMSKKIIRINIMFIIILIASCIALLYKGNDAIALAVEQKEGIITSEQVKLSFDEVNGQLISENVKEGQFVKKGDIIMQLDSTDVDLAIQETKEQLAQIDIQINAIRQTMNTDYVQIDIDEKQMYSEIDAQKAIIKSAQATYNNKKADYIRNEELLKIGAVSRSEMDKIQTDLSIAESNLAEANAVLRKLVSGENINDNMVLPTIEQKRLETDNKIYDIKKLEQQKRILEVNLQEQQVRKQKLTLVAPEDGKIIKILARQGEIISAGKTVILLESNRYYYDIYVNEEQIKRLKEGEKIKGKSVATNEDIWGTIRLISKAPSFADLKQSREKSQADLSAFQIRIYVDPKENILAGMTVEVQADEFIKK